MKKEFLEKSGRIFDDNESENKDVEALKSERDMLLMFLLLVRLHKAIFNKFEF